ncbi:alpha/beta fold hydrolase [Pseudomonas saxonica]|uniref:Alpha/beta fold hydrolase n=1 Tax=Pseudomonas saxonica TaxID=2600598 RepID=A0A5C5Q331_9PSED|nr:alpha/beta fold hydrolase [Pseudomonas saxonica]TWR97929.1 alpha/beta fold hydrolase [Pseudomonas saxonica]
MALRVIASLMGVLMVSAMVHAAEHGVKVLSPEHMNIGPGELSIGVSQDWKQPLPGVQRALIVIHGRLRNAQTYLHSAEQAATQAGQLSTTLIIAPQFLNQTDINRHALPDAVLRWQGNDWMAGAPALGPQPLSSYAALDHILERLGDRKRFPELREVVIAGHSGGAQVVQRYALTTQADTALKAKGIKVRYVVANPSSYAYFTAQRPVPTFDQASCPDFNTWKYGLIDLPAYAKGQKQQALEQAYVERDITYLLGAKDTDPNHPALDKSCEAEAQGAFRLVRGKNYVEYLTQRHPQGLNQRLVEVPGVGHNGDQMFTSPEGQKALFGH